MNVWRLFIRGVELITVEWGCEPGGYDLEPHDGEHIIFAPDEGKP
jgi:hypothetical protein